MAVEFPLDSIGEHVLHFYVIYRKLVNIQILCYFVHMSSWIHTKRKLSGLSQDAVAESLGISRPTYTKLEKGELKPTGEQKAILARLLAVSPHALEKGISVALPSSDVEVREIPSENVEKFKQVLLYILGKVGGRPNIGQVAIYKLLYFADFDYYERFEQQLIGATYIKNTYGPTPVSFAKIVKQMQKEGTLVEVKSKYFGHDQTKYLPVKEADVSQLSGQELNHIDTVLERLAHLSARQLSELSHKDTPWLIAKEREIIDYEYVFYRSEETSVREYESL